MLPARKFRVGVRLPSISQLVAKQARPHCVTTIRSPRPATYPDLGAVRRFEANDTPRHVNNLNPEIYNFEYRPLKHDPLSTAPPTIRLLKLLPGDDLDPVEIILEEKLLTSDLRYEAISYCWGDPKDRSPISCHGRRLLVPRRLEAALRNIRDPNHPKMIWADAICINQSDVSEKDQQVRLMRKIFSHAERTLIWLGDVSEKRQQRMSKFATFSIKFGLAVLRRRVDLGIVPGVSVWDPAQQEHRTVAPFSADFYLELVGMLRMPWFQRAWVVQEVAVSSKATILWGSAQYDWEDVVKALKFMSQVNFPLAFIVTLENISAIENERNFYKKGYNKLYGVLLRHQRCLATDPRDKIYSFCGLVETSSEAQPHVEINYKDNVSSIYRSMARNLLKQSNSLEILSQPPTFTASKVTDLPSWVPDWSISPASTLTYSWGHGSLSLAGAETAIPDHNPRFSATRETVYTPKFQNQDTLMAEGYEFDKVIEVGDIFTGVQVPYTVSTMPNIMREWLHCASTLLHTRKIFKRWQRMANTHSKTPYKTCESMREAFLQTVSSGEMHDSAGIKTELDMWEKVARSALGLPYGAFILIWHFVTNKPFLMFEIQGRYALQRRLVRTKQGYLGLASNRTEVGDSVMLCKGSSVPLMMRRGEGSWSFVGDAYVHGIMKGEAFQAEKCDEMLIT